MNTLILANNIFRPANMILLCLVMMLINEGSSDTRDQIAQEIISKSTVDQIPIVGGNAVRANVTFSILNIRDVFVDKNLVDITFAVFVRWRDPNLSWNFAARPVPWVVVPAKEIWTPDFKIVRNNERPNEYAEDKVLVYSDGNVDLDQMMRITVSCDLSRLQSQNSTCSFQYGSWLYNIASLTMCCEGSSDLTLYQSQHSKYELLSASQRINRASYACCPDFLYDDIELSFSFKRK